MVSEVPELKVPAATVTPLKSIWYPPGGAMPFPPKSMIVTS